MMSIGRKENALKYSQSQRTAHTEPAWKKTTRYCEFCSITTIDKLQSMWKLGQPLYNRLEFVTSTKHVLWAKANEWAFTRLPISFYALSKHFSFRSHPMHACKKRPRIVYLNLIANRSIFHGNSVHASVRQMQMQTMRPYIYIEIRCAQVKYIIHRHRCEWIQCAWVLYSEMLHTFVVGNILASVSEAEVDFEQRFKHSKNPKL